MARSHSMPSGVERRPGGPVTVVEVEAVIGVLVGAV